MQIELSTKRISSTHTKKCQLLSNQVLHLCAYLNQINFWIYSVQLTNSIDDPPKHLLTQVAESGDSPETDTNTLASMQTLINEALKKLGEPFGI